MFCGMFCMHGLKAIETLHAERIGHGYAVVDDNQVYDFVKQNRTHLEVCVYVVSYP